MARRLRVLHENEVLKAWLAAAVSVMAFVPPPALADGPSPPAPVQVVGDNQTGDVTTVVQAPGNDARKRASSNSATTKSSSAVTCRWIENSAHLEGEYLHFLGWGKPGGHWYDVKCSDGSVFLSMYVPPAPNNVPPDVVLAGALAARAVNRLPLPEPVVRVNPRSQALVICRSGSGFRVRLGRRCRSGRRRVRCGRG